jgi:hypothetical protein
MKSIMLSDLKHSPFSLTTFAYQAGLRSQGIPAWKSLIMAHKRKQISSLDIIQKAVEANLIPAQLLDDQEYINAVENCIYLHYLKQPESNTAFLIDKFWSKLSHLADRILMYSSLKLFFRRAYRNTAPEKPCTQPINSKQRRDFDQNWQTFDRQLLILRSWF